MLQDGRLALAKGVLTRWFAEAARARDPVCLVCHGGSGAYTAFAPAVPRGWNQRHIQPIGGGGGTPLQQGLARMQTLAQRGRVQWPGRPVRLWLLTDGRCPQAARPDWADVLTVVDFGQRGFASSAARRLAERWQADYLDRAGLGLASVL